MQTNRLHVVNGVVPIVHCQEVEEEASEIARVVEVARHALWHCVTAIMLQQVHRHDGPLSKEMGNMEKEEELAQVDVRQRDHDQHQEHQFPHHLVNKGASCELLHADELQIRLEHVDGDSGLEQDEVQEVVLVLQLLGAHDVFAKLRELVMAQVVSRHIGADRVPVRERQHQLPQLVRPTLLEHPAVHGVVRGGCAHK